MVLLYITLLQPLEVEMTITPAPLGMTVRTVALVLALFLRLSAAVVLAPRVFSAAAGIASSDTHIITAIAMLNNRFFIMISPLFDYA